MAIQVTPSQKKKATVQMSPCSRQQTLVPSDLCTGSQVWTSCKLLRLISRTMAISAGVFISRLSSPRDLPLLTARKASLVASKERTVSSQAPPITPMLCLVVPLLQPPSRLLSEEPPPSIPPPPVLPRSTHQSPVPAHAAFSDQYLLSQVHPINSRFHLLNTRCDVSNGLRRSVFRKLLLAL